MGEQFSRPTMSTDSQGVTVSPYTDDPLKAYEKLYIKQHVCKVKPLNPATPISENSIRFVCLSDTHSKIERNPHIVPFGDVLLHAGDFTNLGFAEYVDRFNDFLGILPHKLKIVIAGNHDMSFDNTYNDPPESDKSRQFLLDRNLKSVKQLLTNCLYLEDALTDVCGIKMYGSPWTPEFCDMGFNVRRGQNLLDKWNHIPDNTDILMTHGPPLGRGDFCNSGLRAGCVELLNTIQNRVKPKIHLFGHIHEGYGMSSDGHTTFINASNCTQYGKCINPPIVFDFPIPPGHSKSELKAVNTHDVDIDVLFTSNV